MRNVLWICAAVASALTLADARAEGEGLSADADRVPWARFQSRIAYAPGAPGWRADLAPLERSGLQVGSVGLLGDVYFGSTPAPRANAPRRLPRHQRPPHRRAQRLARRRLDADQRPARDGSAPVRRFGRAARRIRPIRRVDNTTVPYIGIGYSNLSTKSGWSFSADLGVVSQSPGNVVRFGRVFGGSQSLDDVVRDMRLAPVVQLGVSYSF